MKRAAATISAFALVISMCFYSYAFVPQRISALHPDFTARLSDFSFDGRNIGASDLTRLEARPASWLEIILSGAEAESDLFLDQNGAAVNTADVTVSKMRAANVAVKADAKSGGEYIESVEVNVKNAGTPAARPVLRVVFASGYMGVERQNFDAELVILIGGVEQPQSSIRIAGSLGCQESSVTAADKTAYSDGVVLAAGEAIPSIEVYAGRGVKAEASMSAGGRYLLSAGPGDGDEDTELLSKNSGVADILKLRTEGFIDGQIKRVCIESDEKLYVYDENFNPIGMTGEWIPVSTKYYLTVNDTDL